MRTVLVAINAADDERDPFSLGVPLHFMFSLKVESPRNATVEPNKILRLAQPLIPLSYRHHVEDQKSPNGNYHWLLVGETRSVFCCQGFPARQSLSSYPRLRLRISLSLQHSFSSRTPSATLLSQRLDLCIRGIRANLQIVLRHWVAT